MEHAVHVPVLQDVKPIFDLLNISSQHFFLLLQRQDAATNCEKFADNHHSAVVKKRGFQTRRAFFFGRQGVEPEACELQCMELCLRCGSERGH